MKTLIRPTSSRGFTLVELLVVIAIIAVLAAAGFAGGTAAMNKARKVSAQTVATSVALAVEQFAAEYSALPDPGSNSTDVQFATNAADGKLLLQILTGTAAAGSTGETKVLEKNPRKIRYFSAKEAKGSRDGLVYSSDGKTIDGLYDPWGQPYYILIDYDYDDQLTFRPGQDVSGAPTLNEVKLKGRKVAVYSLGASKPGGSSENKIAKSW